MEVSFLFIHLTYYLKVQVGWPMTVFFGRAKMGKLYPTADVDTLFYTFYVSYAHMPIERVVGDAV